MFAPPTVTEELSILSVFVASINATRPANGGPKRLVSTSSSPIEISTGEITLLEGGNQSGKSTIIGTLAGAHQTSKKEKVSFGVKVNHAMEIDGVLYSPRSVQDAFSHGIVSVFQDDQLIRTMSIAEQYCLRHSAGHRYIGGVKKLISQSLTKALKAPMENAKNSLPEGHKFRSWIQSKIDNLPQEKRSSEKLIEDATKLLESFDVDGEESFVEVLNKLPDELSGGAKAIVKIVNALLEPKLQFLLLDEAFGGVDSKVWIRAVDNLRRTAEDKNIGILVVTHIQAEKVQWQPSKRYKIVGGEVKKVTNYNNASVIFQAAARTNSEIPLYEIHMTQNIPTGIVNEWNTNFFSPTLAIIDKNIVNLAPTKALLTALRAEGENGPPPLIVDTDTEFKNLDDIRNILDYLADNLKNERSSIVCIGGGILLNAAGFAASIFLRGRVPTLYIPTTITAMADVAIGSKTAANQAYESSPSFRKHVFGSFFDPSAIINSPEFFSSFSRTNLIQALSEVVKHGIVQDKNLLKRCFQEIDKTTLDISNIYELVRKTVFLKQEVIIEDFDERTIGRILQFGHLHAHALEKASRFKIPHDLAVWCGLYIDVSVASPTLELNGVLLKTTLKKVIRNELKNFRLPSQTKMREAYDSETKLEPIKETGHYSLMKLNAIGEYSSVKFSTIDEVISPWDDIFSAWKDLVR